METMGSDGAILTYPQIQNLLRIEFSRARRYDYPLACLAASVDRLERLRDMYGASSGDEIRKQVLQVVQKQTRTSDAVGLSGDRFVVILPHTDGEGAWNIAERLRGKVRELTFRGGERDIHVTLSVGISLVTDRETIFFDSILKGAEQALVVAGSAGGDGVEVARAAGDGAAT
jgi:diguanylate cyclase (GGDEF)-like protein